jgi:hypothetical protein
MEISDSSADQPYKVQVSLHSQYKPLIKRGRSLDEQPSKSEFPSKRAAGESNLDLWLDGSLYPAETSTRKKPRFSDIKSLLEFVGDGHRGMLRYTNSLQSLESLQTRDLEVTQLRLRLDAMQTNFDALCSNVKVRETELLKEVEHRWSEYNILHRRSSNLIASHTTELSHLQKELDESIQAKEELEAKMHAIHSENEQRCHELIQSHCPELEAVQLKKKKLIPYGYRSQIRARKDIHCLSQSGGHAKSLRRLARMIIVPATVKQIQDENAANNTKQRLHSS